MLKVTLTFSGRNRIRYLQRILPTYPTVAEILAWAEELCREDETLSEVAFSMEATPVEAQPVDLDGNLPRRLSHRLFH